LSFKLTIFDSAANAILNPGFHMETWADDCLFTEGPVWHPAGYYLFSDIPANSIYRISTAGEKEIFIEQAGWAGTDSTALSEQTGSNGLALDVAGRLHICQHGNGAIALYDETTLSTFIDGYAGKPFNSPNDLVVDKKGTLYFSDPPYGLMNQQLRPDLRQELAAFYAWRDGELVRFCTEFKYPNGLCLSPDEQTLYVCSSKAFEKKLLAYDTGTLKLKKVVAEENCDGLKSDARGNLWLCTKEGILLLNSEGVRLALIELDRIPSNCCWGGTDMRDLFVTAREAIYCLRNILVAKH
jgi:gluconolactonase